MENNNALQVFNYEGQQVRTVEKDGEIWFVAKDVCDILEISKHRDAVSRLDDFERGSVKVDTLGGIQEMTAVNESGLYALIFRSNKPEAKQFSRWVRSEVLPSIRKTGMYMTPDAVEKILNDPESFITMIRAYQSEKERADLLAHQKAYLEAQQERDRPKVIFADSVTASDNTILIREFAKILKQNGIDIGGTRLYAEFRRLGFLIKSGADYNMPTQKSMDLGLMVVLERTVNRGDGNVLITRTPKITGKGQVYFLNLFLRLQKKKETA